MIRFLFLTLIALMLSEFNGVAQKHNHHVRVIADTLKADSVEYKLIVFDPGFESWLLTRPPMNFYSKEFYATKNQLYVSEWNYRFDHLFTYGNLYNTRIEYIPSVDYGLELNFRLYYYFLYFEKNNGVKLLGTSK